MKQFFLAILLFVQVGGFAQMHIKTGSFSHTLTAVTGDLNKDGLPDKVIVSQDTLHENAPYKLQVFFKETNGQFRLIVTSTKIINPQYPDGRNGYMSGDAFSEVTIKNGVVSVNYELLCGHSEHKFRFQNGNFELIGFSKVSSDGQGTLESIDFNLSTGIRIEKTEQYETNRVISSASKKILIRPLPKLQDGVPMESGLY